MGHIKRLQISITRISYNFWLNQYCKLFEVGTFTGYSTLSMALSLNKMENPTIDKDKQKNMIAKRFFRSAKVLNKLLQKYQMVMTLNKIN